MKAIIDRIDRIDFRAGDRLAISLSLDKSTIIDGSSLEMMLNVFNKEGRVWDLSVDEEVQFSSNLASVGHRLSQIQQSMNNRSSFEFSPERKGRSQPLPTLKNRLAQSSGLEANEFGESNSPEPEGSFFPFMKAKRMERVSTGKSIDLDKNQISDDRSAANYRFYDDDQRTVSNSVILAGFDNYADERDLAPPPKSVKKIQSEANFIPANMGRASEDTLSTSELARIQNMKTCLEIVFEVFELEKRNLLEGSSLNNGLINLPNFKNQVMILGSKLNNYEFLNNKLNRMTLELERKDQDVGLARQQSLQADYRNDQKSTLFLKINSIYTDFVKIGNCMTRASALVDHLRKLGVPQLKEGKIALVFDRLGVLANRFALTEHKLGQLESKIGLCAPQNSKSKALYGEDQIEQLSDQVTQKFFQLAQKFILGLEKKGDKPPRRAKSINKDYPYLLTKLTKAVDKINAKTKKEFERVKMSMANLSTRLEEAQAKYRNISLRNERKAPNDVQNQEDKQMFLEAFGRGKRLDDSDDADPPQEHSPIQFETKMAEQIYRPGNSIEEHDNSDHIEFQGPRQHRVSHHSGEKDTSDLVLGFSNRSVRKNSSVLEHDMDMSGEKETEKKKNYDFRNIPYFDLKDDDDATLQEKDQDTLMGTFNPTLDAKGSKNYDRSMDQSSTPMTREQQRILDLLRQFYDLRNRPIDHLSEATMIPALIDILNEYEELEMRIAELEAQTGPKNIELEEPMSNSRVITKPEPIPTRFSRPNLNIEIEEFADSDAEKSPKMETSLKAHSDLLAIIKNELNFPKATPLETIKKLKDLLSDLDSKLANERPPARGPASKFRQ